MTKLEAAEQAVRDAKAKLRADENAAIKAHADARAARERAHELDRIESSSREAYYVAFRALEDLL